MKKGLKFFRLIFFLGIMILTAFSLFAQDINSPQLPSLNVTISKEYVSDLGEEVRIKIKVTPLESMLADIRCFLPKGIKPLREKGVYVYPYHKEDKDYSPYQDEYQSVVGLWKGGLEKGVSKEFSFSAFISAKGEYRFIVGISRIEVSPRQIFKEKAFVIKYL